MSRNRKRAHSSFAAFSFAIFATIDWGVPELTLIIKLNERVSLQRNLVGLSISHRTIFACPGPAWQSRWAIVLPLAAPSGQGQFNGI